MGNQTINDINSSNCEYKHLDVCFEDDWIIISQYIRSKFGKLNILVNNAGITGFIESLGPHDPENLDISSWRKVHAINSEGEAKDVAYAALYLASDESKYVTGIELNVDGRILSGSSATPNKND
ncbi:SDR family oxidoreductase [Francisella orientalis]|uniref:Short chain dehydrogenase/reductase family oxidoreductase n=1 Tax=Francisella orientalis TaxID=299583 RepID=A0ABN4GZF0_9GAMM|nr:short chain dehydrogenase/reductase family oxidoreductase [Francisella orientalis str. Toba 04]AKN85780.1 Short chain dehydrogenase/reductase family oxidoreductase [Francisella orientalis FNO12]AKN87319.1 Short chain dehydrogenase/reductase family oxidoreductase [Francisella orientalis FNO24]AKN88856.1 Short chain dehydrogenase/reductase family oxidoreductase [Francisella orientalis]AKU05615.1 Short chain dehydrogenase/reductase family oxidoreductase [Francisella orientalis]